MNTLLAGELVTGLTGEVIGQVLEILDRTVVVETGNEITIFHKSKVQPFHLTIGSVAGSDCSSHEFVIEEFYFGDISQCWKATGKMNEAIPVYYLRKGLNKV